MMVAKLTKKQMYKEIIARLQGKQGAEPTVTTDDMISALQHEIELLEKKHSTSGSSKKAKENNEFLEALKEAMEEFDTPISISEFQKQSSSELAKESNQKLSAFMKKLVDRGDVIRTTDKKRAVFILASQTVDTETLVVDSE